MDTRTMASTLVLTSIMAMAPEGSSAGEPGDFVDAPVSAVVSDSGTGQKPFSNGASLVSSVPRISSRVSKPVRKKLESSFEVALRKIGESSQCRALFTDLGADGVELLSTTLYYPASLKLEKQICSEALGWTTVGAAPTFLCRRFSKLSDRRAASVLIHEALHHAGLDEWPHDPEGLPPSAIDDLVTEACNL
jgi:hypothetical protein